MALANVGIMLVQHPPTSRITTHAVGLKPGALNRPLCPGERERESHFGSRPFRGDVAKSRLETGPRKNGPGVGGRAACYNVEELKVIPQTLGRKKHLLEEMTEQHLTRNT